MANLKPDRRTIKDINGDGAVDWMFQRDDLGFYLSSAAQLACQLRHLLFSMVALLFLSADKCSLPTSMATVRVMLFGRVMTINSGLIMDQPEAIPASLVATHGGAFNPPKCSMSTLLGMVAKI